MRTEFLDVNASEKLSVRPEVRAALEDFGPPVFVEHERIPFATFPYEWPPEMLYAAAELTIDLAERLLSECDDPHDVRVPNHPASWSQSRAGVASSNRSRPR